MGNTRAVLSQVFAIDEAQFFGDLLEFCVRAADTDGKLVLVAGLDGDFRRQRFGQARPACRPEMPMHHLDCCRVQKSPLCLLWQYGH